MVWKERLKKANAWLHSALPDLRPFGRRAGPALKWVIWEFLGIHTIWNKIKPPPEKEITRKPATFFLWFVGIYFALFGIASQRYENKVDIIENRASLLLAQLATPAKKQALSRIPLVQNMKCPARPELQNPISIFMSLLYDVKCEVVVTLLKETIEDWKNDLQGVRLAKAILPGIDLSGANLQDANLRGIDLRKANLSSAILQNADLSIATTLILKSKFYVMEGSFSPLDTDHTEPQRTNLSGANLYGANLQGASLFGADLRGAIFFETNLKNVYLYGADLREAKFLFPEQLSKVETLYQAKLDPDLLAQLKEKYPHLLEKLIKEPVLSKPNPHWPSKHPPSPQR